METKPVFVRCLSLPTNVNSKCLVIHTIFLPNEYLYNYWCMNIRLDSSFVKIDTKLVGKQIGRILSKETIHIFAGSVEADHMRLWDTWPECSSKYAVSKGNRNIYIISFVKTVCLQPCPYSHAAVTFIRTKMLRCDLCDGFTTDGHKWAIIACRTEQFPTCRWSSVIDFALIGA